MSQSLNLIVPKCLTSSNIISPFEIVLNLFCTQEWKQIDCRINRRESKRNQILWYWFWAFPQSVVKNQILLGSRVSWSLARDSFWYLIWDQTTFLEQNNIQFFTPNFFTQEHLKDSDYKQEKFLQKKKKTTSKRTTKSGN